MVGHGLGEHCLAAARRAVPVIQNLSNFHFTKTFNFLFSHEHTARRVDTDLLVEVEVGQRQLDGLLHLLLLHVHPADVGVRHVGLLIGL